MGRVLCRYRFGVGTLNLGERLIADQAPRLLRGSSAQYGRQRQKAGEVLRRVEFIHQAVVDRHKGPIRQSLHNLLAKFVIRDCVIDAPQKAVSILDGLLIAQTARTRDCRAMIMGRHLKTRPVGAVLLKDRHNLTISKRRQVGDAYFTAK